MEKTRLLILEDMEFDVAIMQKVLQRSGMLVEVSIAVNKTEFVAAITGHVFDVILSDNSLPDFDATQALQILREHRVDTPVILVTGTVSEEFAVQMMRSGAYDYILKDRLQRLPGAITNAIEKHRLETEKKKHMEALISKEALMNESEKLAHLGSWQTDLENQISLWSDEHYCVLGYQPGEVAPGLDCFFNTIHPDDRDTVKQRIDAALADLQNRTFTCRIVNKDGTIRYLENEIFISHNEHRQPTRIHGCSMDVTRKKLSELKEKTITEDLVQRNNALEQFAYIIAHNLRGPVSTILGLSDMMLEGDTNDADRMVYLSGISESVKKLDGVIIDLNTMIQYRNAENKNTESVHFSDILRDIVTDIKDAAQQQLIIKEDFSQVSGMVTLKSYIHSIFYNLISNSIKYRQPSVPAVIEIKSERAQDKIRLLFIDNGLGIDMDKKGGEIFGLYKRFHTTAAEGKGMGLFMVKTQVETLGGKISVTSAVNMGTQFIIEFHSQN